MSPSAGRHAVSSHKDNDIVSMEHVFSCRVNRRRWTEALVADTPIMLLEGAPARQLEYRSRDPTDSLRITFPTCCANGTLYSHDVAILAASPGRKLYLRYNRSITSSGSDNPAPRFRY